MKNVCGTVGAVGFDEMQYNFVYCDYFALKIIIIIAVTPPVKFTILMETA